MTRGEFDWIDRLAAIVARSGAPLAPGAVGIGDDAAIVPAEGGGAWAWTVDVLVEGVHFRFDWLDPAEVGRRALAASLSDLAAAGALPAGALVTAAGSADAVGARLEAIYGGLAAASAEWGCPILGGDLARADGPLHLGVTALGRVAGGPPLLRSGARPGDEVWLTGALGAPAAALTLLAAGADGAEGDPARARLAAPVPRHREIAWLRARAGIRAAIDVSDGLSSDLAHVARASGARIAIDIASVPVHGAAAAAAARLGADAVEWALHGGEEFELVLVAPPGALAPHAAEFEAGFGVPLTRIGAVEEGSGVAANAAGGARPLEPRGWDHFRG